MARPPAKNLYGEPVVILSVVEGAVAMILSIGGLNVSAKEMSVIMAVVVAAAGCYHAFATKDQLLAAGVALVKALIALAAAYDLNLSSTQTATVIALATTLLGLVHRTQTSPSTGLSIRDAAKAT